LSDLILRPYGLAFCHLKGVVEFMQQMLENNASSATLVFARVQLSNAVRLYHESMNEAPKDNIVPRIYQRCTREWNLLQEAESMLEKSKADSKDVAIYLR